MTDYKRSSQSAQDQYCGQPIVVNDYFAIPVNHSNHNLATFLQSTNATSSIAAAAAAATAAVAQSFPLNQGIIPGMPCNWIPTSIHNSIPSTDTTSTSDAALKRGPENDVRVYRVWPEPPDLTSPSISTSSSSSASLSTVPDDSLHSLAREIGISSLPSSLPASSSIMSPLSPCFQFNASIGTSAFYYTPSRDGIGESTLNFESLLQEDETILLSCTGAASDGLISPCEEQIFIEDIPNTIANAASSPSSRRSSLLLQSASISQTLDIAQQQYFTLSSPQIGNQELLAPFEEESDNDVTTAHNSDNNFSNEIDIDESSHNVDEACSTPQSMEFSHIKPFSSTEPVSESRAQSTLVAASVALAVDIPLSPTDTSFGIIDLQNVPSPLSPLTPGVVLPLNQELTSPLSSSPSPFTGNSYDKNDNDSDYLASGQRNIQEFSTFSLPGHVTNSVMKAMSKAKSPTVSSFRLQTNSKGKLVNSKTPISLKGDRSLSLTYDSLSQSKFPPTIVKSKSTSSIRRPRASLPGPIPATIPTFVKKDESGTDWISFQYSRKRVRSTYCIRCDVESVDISKLDPQFKADNCIYPRAAVPPEEYRGNRQKYESECNCIGWCLAYLNPELVNRRGLIQRAVDSWRNTNSDPTLRSRRVRKMTNREDDPADEDKKPIKSLGS
ncbi:hypothetical protein AWJ20_4376 [Sugiyamaella lignohabitans]|uniref:DUF8032 domain-containing protein n=1 Tax=Sugiyamaella lignohabitans TaxID=796027 RepID=A0A167CDQ1_9ASCO|nr:uncharacterized protein AWJ20_4376 [Sugiyamaella lignohabitans]ANB11556.1 hypothetical protein AWJ20_4376 [Sugiyamaella lignohabitans]